MNTTSAVKKGQQPCSWIPMGEEEEGKQKTHLKSVYFCIQKRPTSPTTSSSSTYMEDVFPCEWVVDKDMMTTKPEAEEGKVREATAPAPPPPGDCWVEGTLTPAVAEMPYDVQWGGSIFVALGSRIYALGGVFPWNIRDLSKSVPMQTALKHVCFCDVARPEEGWKRGPDLNYGRFNGSAVALNGRIYMFGGTMTNGVSWSSQPYTEVHHPVNGQWTPRSLPPPEDCELFVPPEVYGAHPLPDGRILLHSSRTLLSYNVDTDSFSSFDNHFGVVACEASVFLDDFLFFYRNERGVYGYDVVNRKWLPSPVRGLRKGSVIPPDDEFQTCLLHLGGGRLCIVWSGCAIKDRNKLIIHSTVFRDDDDEEEDPNKLFVPLKCMEPISFPTGASAFYYSVWTVLSYNAEADSFSLFDNDFGGFACNAAVVLDGVLFFYRDRRGVYGCDVVNRKWFPSAVGGLRKGTFIPYGY
ncbi:hypothetical protein RHGRI_018152 [Rhododendron griersonianum]|uniref:Galactose oxidase/kelch repeat superfamily protein n=1 Tax=Rhododendron griersonianum TaxID=479676 RepID=A0AAV6K0E3_9ERIC|nr:hypothetical protein RHGRI_018152 [Rhododendron griersonianum]